MSELAQSLDYSLQMNDAYKNYKQPFRDTMQISQNGNVVLRNTSFKEVLNLMVSKLQSITL